MNGREGPPRAERTAWALLAVTATVLVALSVASSSNYASVVVANVTPYIVPRFSIAYLGAAPDGTLTLNSSVRASLSLRVENPSARTLRFQLVAYGGWIEDRPAEDGVNMSRIDTDKARSDGLRTRYFFPAFGKSLEVTENTVPALGNATVPLSFDLTHADDPARFDAVRNITAYAVARNGTMAAAPWNHWVRVVFTIDGVPEPTNPSAGHLSALRRTEREWGDNLAR